MRNDGATRRGVLAGAGAVGVAALGGCLATRGTGEGEYGGWMSDARSYEGTTVDRTDASAVTVRVGAADGLAYAPAAVRVTPGTTVTWEWTGEGNRHNVVEEDDGGYRSQTHAAEGRTFAHTFDAAGVSKYYCGPHRSLGMKGVVDVVDGEG